MKLERVINLIQFRRQELAALLQMATSDSDKFKYSKELLEKVCLLVIVQTDRINEIEKQLVALKLKARYK